MRATAYIDDIAVPLGIIGDDDRDEGVPGGYGRASFTAIVPVQYKQRLLGAPIYIYAAAGPPWAGKVSRVSQVKHGICKVECDGWQEAFGRKVRAALYARTDFLGDLEPRTGQAGATYNTGAFSNEIAGGKLIIRVNPQASVTAGNMGIMYLWGTEPLDHLDFDVYVSHANVSLAIYNSDTESALSTSIKTVTATGATASQTADADGHYGIAICCVADTNFTAADSSYYIEVYNATLYGVDFTVTVANVIDDVCDQLSTDDLPAGTAYRAWLEADATEVEPLVFTPESTDAQKVEEILRYTDKEFGIWSRRVAGVWTPVPVLRDPGTSPDYICTIGKNATSDITDADIEPLASAVRVMRHDADGRTAYDDVTDSDTSHYLVQRGITKWATIRADTSSSALAQTIGAQFLALAGLAQVAGDITITNSITDAAGAKVLPCEIEAGRRILVLGLDSGAVTGRITSVKKRGSHHAVVTINNAPRALDVYLARLAKRDVA